MGSPKLVVLDLDRTLVFREGFDELYLGLIPHLGVDPEEAAGYWHKHQGTPVPEQLQALGVKESDAHQFTARLFRQAEALPAKALPGAQEMLEALKARGVSTAVSNGSGQRLAEAALKQTGLSGLVDLVLGSEADCAKGPQHISIILNRFEADPARSAAVGDGRRDMQIAHQAGFPLRIGVMLIPSGPNAKDDLIAGGATHLADSLVEAQGLLNQ